METQQGFTLWLTGMSGAGKSALASYVARRLPLVGRRVELLDPTELGDLAPDGPDATGEERDRTVRLLGWVAKLLTRNGTVPVVAAVSPHREVRDDQRRQIGRFFEVMVECPFEILMERDTKGIYRRALAGELQNVVGVQAPYEPPLLPEAVADMAAGDVEAAAAEIFEKLASHGYITRHEREVLVNGSAPAGEMPKAGKGGKAKGAASKAAAKAPAAAKPAAAKGAKPAATAATPAAAKSAKPAATAATPPAAKGAKPSAAAVKPATAKGAKPSAAAVKPATAKGAKTAAAAAKPAAAKGAKPAATGSKPAAAKGAKPAATAAKPAAKPAKPAAKPAKSAKSAKAAKPAGSSAKTASQGRAPAGKIRAAR